MTQALKVELEWGEYAQRGLQIDAGLVERVGEQVVVFDKNLDFTNHRVTAIEGSRAVISPALPWPGRARP